MEAGRKNTDLNLAGTHDIQTRRSFSDTLKRHNKGKEFAKELKNRNAVTVAFPVKRKKFRKTIRRVKIGMMETYRAVRGKRKKQSRMKAVREVVSEDKKSRMLTLKKSESVRLEKNLHHLTEQKKALEKAMQNYVEAGRKERCQRLIGRIDLKIEKKSIQIKTLHFRMMVLRADRYINGYRIVERDAVRKKIYITHKQLFSLSRQKKMSEKKYEKKLKKEKAKQTLAGRIKGNTKHYAGNLIKGTVKDAAESGKQKLTEELDKQEDLGNDAVKLFIESPQKTLEGAKALKHGVSNIVRAPGRMVRGTWNTGKNIYKTGRAAIRGADNTVKAILKAKRWAVAFARSKQKTVMIKQAMEQTAKMTAQAAKAIAHAAIKIILFVIKSLISIGLPVVLIAAIIIFIAAAVSMVMTSALEPYLDQDAMEATADLCNDYLTDYLQWVEEYKEEFIETNCYTECDYNNNDTVLIQYVSDGYQTFVDKRALIVYAAAYAKFGDISLIGESGDGLASQDAEEIRIFMQECLSYLNPKEESLITGADQRFKEDKCREEEDTDGEYRHKHEYGEWRLGFRLRTENELLQFLGFDEEQLEIYHSMVAEFSRQVQEENDYEVASKGFSLTDYFDFFGGSNTSDDVLADLIDIGDIELTEVTEFSLQYVGNPYVWGGNSLTNGVDCSGFVKAVYENFGVTGIPRTSAEQSKTGKLVPSLNEARPGDLIFYGQPVHHVALYLGGGQIVHASNSKPYPAGGIKVSSATYSTITCIRRWVDE